MARKQVKDKERPIATWAEAEAAMAEYAIAQTRIEREEAAYNHDEQKRRERMTEAHAPLRTEMEAIEQGMKKFCMTNRADFGGKQSKELGHGTVSFRVGNPKVDKVKGFTFEAVLDLLKGAPDRVRRMFIRTKEELNREAVLANDAVAGDPDADPESYISPAVMLKEYKLFVTQDETFGIEIKKAVETV